MPPLRLLFNISSLYRRTALAAPQSSYFSHVACAQKQALLDALPQQPALYLQAPASLPLALQAHRHLAAPAMSVLFLAQASAVLPAFDQISF